MVPKKRKKESLRKRDDRFPRVMYKMQRGGVVPPGFGVQSTPVTYYSPIKPDIVSADKLAMLDYAPTPSFNFSVEVGESLGIQNTAISAKVNLIKKEAQKLSQMYSSGQISEEEYNQGIRIISNELDKLDYALDPKLSMDYERLKSMEETLKGRDGVMVKGSAFVGDPREWLRTYNGDILSTPEFMLYGIEFDPERLTTDIGRRTVVHAEPDEANKTFLEYAMNAGSNEFKNRVSKDLFLTDEGKLSELGLPYITDMSRYIVDLYYYQTYREASGSGSKSNYNQIDAAAKLFSEFNNDATKAYFYKKGAERAEAELQKLFNQDARQGLTLVDVSANKIVVDKANLLARRDGLLSSIKAADAEIARLVKNKANESEINKVVKRKEEFQKALKEVDNSIKRLDEQEETANNILQSLMAEVPEASRLGPDFAEAFMAAFNMGLIDYEYDEKSGEYIFDKNRALEAIKALMIANQMEVSAIINTPGGISMITRAGNYASIATSRQALEMISKKYGVDYNAFKAASNALYNTFNRYAAYMANEAHKEFGAYRSAVMRSASSESFYEWEVDDGFLKPDNTVGSQKMKMDLVKDFPAFAMANPKDAKDRVEQMGGTVDSKSYQKKIGDGLVQEVNFNTYNTGHSSDMKFSLPKTARVTSNSAGILLSIGDNVKVILAPTEGNAYQLEDIVKGGSVVAGINENEYKAKSFTTVHKNVIGKGEDGKSQVVNTETKLYFDVGNLKPDKIEVDKENGVVKINDLEFRVVDPGANISGSPIDYLDTKLKQAKENKSIVSVGVNAPHVKMSDYDVADTFQAIGSEVQGGMEQPVPANERGGTIASNAFDDIIDMLK